MTLYHFNQLHYARQLAHGFSEDTYLARRWEAETAIKLYHLPGGVFVKLFYNLETNDIDRLRAFTSAACPLYRQYYFAAGLTPRLYSWLLTQPPPRPPHRGASLCPPKKK